MSKEYNDRWNKPLVNPPITEGEYQEQKAKKRDSVDKLIAYENNELSYEEAIELFQDLVNSGLAWKLQGHYGRTAMALLRAGEITAK